MRRAGKFEISLDLLAELLGLPEDAVITGVIGDVHQQVYRRTVKIVVEHPDLYKLREGECVPDLYPDFGDEEGRKLKLLDWGIGG